MNLSRANAINAISPEVHSAGCEKCEHFSGQSLFFAVNAFNTNALSHLCEKEALYQLYDLAAAEASEACASFNCPRNARAFIFSQTTCFNPLRTC